MFAPFADNFRLGGKKKCGLKKYLESLRHWKSISMNIHLIFFCGLWSPAAPKFELMNLSLDPNDISDTIATYFFVWKEHFINPFPPLQDWFSLFLFNKGFKELLVGDREMLL